MIMYCPKCGKILHESKPPETRMNSFWCNDCRLDIAVSKRRKCFLRNVVWDLEDASYKCESCKHYGNCNICSDCIEGSMRELIELPTEIEVPYEIAEDSDDNIIDAISDAYGWLIESCNVVRKE